jgi:hypothetical protein
VFFVPDFVANLIVFWSCFQLVGFSSSRDRHGAFVEGGGAMIKATSVYGWMLDVGYWIDG